MSQGGRVLSEQLGGVVWHASQNPYPIKTNIHLWLLYTEPSIKPFSDWPKAYSEFSKSVSFTS